VSNPYSDREEMVKLYPAPYQPAYRRVMQGRSPKGGIRLFCLQCMGMSFHEVEGCTATACPLYPYRRKGDGK